MKPLKSLVLLSGGMDSALCLALEKDAGRDGAALGIDYGARHNQRELRAAALLAEYYETEFLVLRFGLPPGWGGSLMRKDDPRLTGTTTVVPARNVILLSMAAGVAMQQGYNRLVVGCNATDRDLYPDCRWEFLTQLDLAFRSAYGVGVHAPLIDLTKSEICLEGDRLGLDWDLTYSCYTGEEEPCQVCGACWARAQAFSQVALKTERAERQAGRNPT